MFFHEAYADVPGQTSTTVAAGTPPNGPTAAQVADPMLMNVGMVLVLAALFYLLLVRPQQKRFKEHESMINRLEKGTKVVTQGGLVGVIEKNTNDQEVVIDFGNNIKISMLRSYILGRYDDAIAQPANDDSKNKKDKSSK